MGQQEPDLETGQTAGDSGQLSNLDESPPVRDGSLEKGIPREKLQTIPSGSLSLDIALGIGGWPRGQIIELYGPESSGKSTLAMHMIAEAQKLGSTAALIDADRAADPFAIERLGVDIDNVYFKRPDCLEEAFNYIETLLRKKTVDVVVVDSIAALLPIARLESDGYGPGLYFNDSGSGSPEAEPAINQIVRNGLRKILVHLDKCRATVLFTNKLDRMYGVMFGSPETTSFGTHALKLYASIRVDLRRIQAIKMGGDVIGNRCRVKVKKNRFARPFTEAEFDLMYDDGISYTGDLVDLGVTFKLIEKKGAYYRYGDELIGQGRENAKLSLLANHDLMQKLDSLIRQEAGLVR